MSVSEIEVPPDYQRITTDVSKIRDESVYYFDGEIAIKPDHWIWQAARSAGNKGQDKRVVFHFNVMDDVRAMVDFNPPAPKNFELPLLFLKGKNIKVPKTYQHLSTRVNVHGDTELLIDGDPVKEIMEYEHLLFKFDPDLGFYGVAHIKDGQDPNTVLP